MLKALSFGAGVQTTALLLLANQGEIDFDVAIFSDTGSEPKRVHEQIEKIKKLNRIPFFIVSAGNLKNDILNGGRVANPPFFTSNGGRLLRQCTQDYKIKPIERKIREILGIKRGGEEVLVEMNIGFSTDEITRMKPSKKKWIKNVFPLIDMGLSRDDCKEIIKKAGLGPIKSSCTFCPFRKDQEWLCEKNSDTDVWQDAVSIDNEIRKQRKTKYDCFVHKKRRPLEEIEFEAKDDYLFDLFEYDCDGVCGL